MSVLVPLLEVADLEVDFPSANGPIAVLDHVSFSIHSGETFCLVGESGAGKSLTGLAIVGLHPDTAHVRGSVRLADDEILHNRRQAWRKIRGTRIGFVFQDASTALNPVLNIKTQLKEAFRHRFHSDAEGRKEMVDLLNRLGISDAETRLGQYPHQLSGGLRQRIHIAIAIAGNPELIIADEPTSALDVTIQAQILELLRALVADRGKSLLMITHDLGVVAEMADRVGVMYGGRIVEMGDAALTMSSPQHPYTADLLGSLPSLSQRSASLRAIPVASSESQEATGGCAYRPRCSMSKGREECRNERPRLSEVADGVWSACHFPGEVRDYRARLVADAGREPRL